MVGKKGKINNVRRLGVEHGDEVMVRIVSESRPVIFEKCSARVGKNLVLELHIDTDEANAGDIGQMQKRKS
ncbi:PduL/EutD family phosphate acyltransferase [Brevibacillus daliensis]|uniref:PduL/EutD family phosphate acyltransferase n=1 Tax=Brevibacillus daliensis TaxID=2892995 RepID=UPI00281595A7|nr:PduL/EutD family phosphate acyltransferase [Brevibacillus daliensis]